MTVKEVAKKVIDSLPEEANLDEIIHALYIQAKFDRGLKEIDEGKGIPHEEAKKQMKTWPE
jgi:predicted transcriptional regulator